MITRCTKRNSLIAGALLLCSAGAVWWLYTYSTQLHTDLHTKKEEIARFEVHKKDLAVAKESAMAAGADRQLLEEYLLTENETVAFLTDLEDAARSDGVAMETESLLIKDDKSLPYIELGVSGSGSRASLMQFLARLETLHYASWVEQVAWSRTDDGAKVEVTLHILLLPS